METRASCLRKGIDTGHIVKGEYGGEGTEPSANQDRATTSGTFRKSVHLNFSGNYLETSIECKKT